MTKFFIRTQSNSAHVVTLVGLPGGQEMADNARNMHSVAQKLNWVSAVLLADSINQYLALPGRCAGTSTVSSSSTSYVILLLRRM